MIPIVCRTNLDNYQRETWPRTLAFPPRVGDWIQSESRKLLRICEVTFLFDGTVEVGLHK